MKQIFLPSHAADMLALVLLSWHMMFTLGSWKSSVSSSHHIDTALVLA